MNGSDGGLNGVGRRVSTPAPADGEGGGGGEGGMLRPPSRRARRSSSTKSLADHRPRKGLFVRPHQVRFSFSRACVPDVVG